MVTGVFSTVSRLAAIVIRVGFKHVEDSYYLFFAQMLRRGLPPDQQVSPPFPPPLFPLPLKPPPLKPPPPFPLTHPASTLHYLKWEVFQVES